MEFDIITVIGQLGFPIAVATYSLVVLNKTMKENTEFTKEMLILLREMKGAKIDDTR
jgi:hypothetical protein